MSAHEGKLLLGGLAGVWRTLQGLVRMAPGSQASHLSTVTTCSYYAQLLVPGPASVSHKGAESSSPEFLGPVILRVLLGSPESSGIRGLVQRGWPGGGGPVGEQETEHAAGETALQAGSRGYLRRSGP